MAFLFALLEWANKHSDKFVALSLATLILHSCKVIYYAYNGTFEWFGNDFWGWLLAFTAFVGMRQFFHE